VEKQTPRRTLATDAEDSERSGSQHRDPTSSSRGRATGEEQVSLAAELRHPLLRALTGCLRPRTTTGDEQVSLAAELRHPLPRALTGCREPRTTGFELIFSLRVCLMVAAAVHAWLPGRGR
jgi:hypothetical protein